MSEEGEVATIETSVGADENAPTSEDQVSLAPASDQADNGDATAVGNLSNAGDSQVADAGSAEAPSFGDDEANQSTDVDAAVADGDAVVSTESGEHAGEPTPADVQNAASPADDDSTRDADGDGSVHATADPGNDETATGDADGEGSIHATAELGNSEASTGDADGEGAVSDALISAPVIGGAVDEPSDVDGATKEILEGALSVSNHSNSPLLHVSDPPEAPTAAPAKPKGSADYPLAELTRSGELPYYTPAQVSSHCVAADCWLSLLGKVIDVTELVRTEDPQLMQSLVSAAGTDISHWFTKDGELKVVYDLKSGLRRYQTPGDLPLLHAPPPHPDAAFDMSFGEPWWRQKKLVVGNLTQKTRKLRVVNMLLSSSHVIDVCAEQKISDINDLYRSYNAHAGSYTWKKLNKQGKMETLDYQKTLHENDLPDMSRELAELLIDEVRFFSI
jgi:hypothetical protein